MTLTILLSALLGYLLGSLPSAFLLVRWKTSRDIRQSGSGNVGALNSYLVTRSRLVGAAVLVLDLLKGVAATLAPGFLFGGGITEAAVAGLGAVIGHNFPVWLGFRGGRGLATAAGVALVLGWPVVPAWALFWVAGFLATRNVNMGNALATFLLMIAGLVAPLSLFELLAPGVSTIAVRIYIVLIFGVILIKHIAPVLEYVRKRRTASRTERTGAEA